MNILKQSTAATIKLGPFIDDTDGKTAETGLTISQADIRLSKNGGDIAQTNNSAGATHDELGYYNVPLDATDTNTLGRLLVAVHESGALPVWQEFLVVTANVYDTLCSTDTFDVNVTSLADDVITSAKFDESTAYPLKSADTGATAVARTGADSDTLETLSDQMDSTALEATLTAIKGSGWTNETLVALKAYVDEIESRLTAARAGYLDKLNVSGTLAHSNDAATYKADVSALATAAALDAVDNYIDTEVPAIKAKTDLIPASPAEAGEYTAAIAAIQADLDNPDQYKADVSGLATTAHVQEVENKIDAIDVTVNTIPTNPLLDTAYTAPDNAGIAAIQEKTEQLTFTAPNKVDAAATVDSSALSTIAGGVWSHARRTLTVPAVAMSDPNEPTTLMLYRDADINIEFTGLTIPTGAKKVVFTIKDNLDDADTLAVLQATYELTAVPAETHTLNYINSAAPPELTTPVTFTVDADSVEFDMTAAAAYYLPRYERGYLNWDLKLITATSVQILQQGLVQILGTSTRKVA